MIDLRSFIKHIKPYKPGKPIEEVIRELGLKGAIIKLASNENPLGPSPLALQAIKEKINEINLYPDDNCFYLKKKMSAHFNQPVENIIIGSGSVELIELIFKAFVNPGDEVIMSEPSFIMYRITCQIFGGKRVAIALNDYAHNIKAIVDKINHKTKIIVIDNPINPTGTIINKKDFDYLIKNIPDHALLVVDEAYKEYIDSPDYPDAEKYLKDNKNLIILHTFSKIYGLAGLRIGYGFSQPEIIEALMKVRLPFNVNLIAQIAGRAALDDHKFVKKSIENNENGKKFLYAGFKKLGIDFVPTFGNFILVNLKNDAKEVFEAAKRKGIILRTILEYGLPNSLRITIGTPEQNKKLIEVLEEIVK